MQNRISARIILWLMIGSYLLVMGATVCLRHYNFQTQTWDLAAFAQSFWNASHGRGLVNSLEQVHNHLGLHFSPFLFLLVPGYVIFQSPYYLLLLQTIALALGAWPLYLLASRFWPRGRWPLIIAAGYLLYSGLHWANLYDFHEITFFVPLMLAALYFLEEQRWGWLAVFLVLAASVKEDAILAVAFAGVYLLFKKNSEQRWLTTQRKIGITIIVLALIYFILAVKVFMPALGGGALRLDRYANLGGNPAEIVKNIVIHPSLLPGTVFSGAKLSYLFWLFLPVMFLPWFSWRSLILLLPGLPENLLTNYRFQFSGLYHYDAVLIPGIFLGMIYGLQMVLTKWPAKERWIRGGLMGAILASFLLRSPLGLFSLAGPVSPIKYFTGNSQWQAYRQLVRLVPPGISVAANTNLVPHLTDRERIYQLGQEPLLMDMVLIDTADPFGFTGQADFQTYVDSYLKTGLYKSQIFNNRYVVIFSNKFRLTSPAQ